MEQEVLCAAQVMFALVSKLIYLEPTADDMRFYMEADLFSQVPFGEDDPEVVTGLVQMQSWCLETSEDPDSFDSRLADLRRDQFQLFVGAGIPDAPSWAGYYLSTDSQILSEETLPVRRLYREFGLQMEHLNREPDDNLGIMLSFLAHLIDIETDPIEPEDKKQRAASAQQELLVERILPWLASWHYLVNKHARTEFYRGIGNVTFGLVRTYAQRFDIRYDSKDQRFVISAHTTV
ncbi:MAG: molecular chaperone TorD family protein [Coriobacteriales bacterium]|nr:molecular chaperone TorD family protein [Coriobacteriales bacterium]